MPVRNPLPALPPAAPQAPVAPAGPRFPQEPVPPVPELPGPGPAPARPSAIPGGVGLALDAMAGGRNQQLVLAAIRKTLDDYNASFAQWKADESRRLELKYQAAREDAQLAEERNLRRQQMEVSAGQTQEQIDIQKAEEARTAALFPEQQKLAVAQRRVAEIEANMANDIEQAKLGQLNADIFQSRMQGHYAGMQTARELIDSITAGRGKMGGGAGAGAGAAAGGPVKPGTVSPEIESTDPEAAQMRILSSQLQELQTRSIDPNATPEERQAAAQGMAAAQVQIDNLRKSAVYSKYLAANLGVGAAQLALGAGPNPGAFATAEDYTNAITNAPPDLQPYIKAIFAALPDQLTGDPGNMATVLATSEKISDIAPGAIDAAGAFYTRAMAKFDMASHPEETLDQATERGMEMWSQALRDNTPTSELPYMEQIIHEAMPALRGAAAAAPAPVAPAAPITPAIPEGMEGLTASEAAELTRLRKRGVVFGPSNVRRKRELEHKIKQARSQQPAE